MLKHAYSRLGLCLSPAFSRLSYRERWKRGRDVSAVLSDTEATAFEGWVGVAESCADASQKFVGASGNLSMVSRDLADSLDGNGSDFPQHLGDRKSLAEALRTLATSVEEHSREARDRYPMTEETLHELRSIAGLDGDAD
jgi:hypothetical protein